MTIRLAALLVSAVLPTLAAAQEMTQPLTAEPGTRRAAAPWCAT